MLGNKATLVGLRALLDTRWDCAGFVSCILFRRLLYAASLTPRNRLKQALEKKIMIKRGWNPQEEKMILRKAVLASCTLLLLFSVSIFSEQGVVEKTKDISQQLKEATCLRNWGIIITSTGIATTVVLTEAVFVALVSAINSDLESIAAPQRDFIPYLAVYSGLALIVGPTLWICGARRIRNARKSEITLQLRGPDLARGQKLGGISLVYSY
jgi:hypothetical protein